MSLKQFSSALPSAYKQERKIQYPGGPMVNLDDVLRSAVACQQPEPERPPSKLRLLGASGNIAPYIVPSLAVANENAIARPATKVHAIPSSKGLLAPPIIVHGRKFVEAINALRHLTMSREAAALDARFLYMGAKLTYDGANTLVVEATDTNHFGIAMVPARQKEPTPPWTMVVPLEQILRSLLALAPDADIELAPSDRLHVAKSSFAPTGVPSEFNSRPALPVDIDFQAIISKKDLAHVVSSVTAFIPIDAIRVALRNIWFDPKRKLAAATDSKQLRYFQIDIRSKPRLTHPQPFYIPFFVAMAASKLEAGPFVLVSITRRKEIYIAGEDDQDYSLYSNEQGQADMLDYENTMPEPFTEFVVSKTAVIEAAKATMGLYSEKDGERGLMPLHFDVRELQIRAEVASSLGTGNVWRDIAYKKAPMVFPVSSITIPPHQILDAANNVEGDDMYIGFRKHHGEKDPIMVYGPDHKVMTVIAQIVKSAAKFGAEENT